MIGRFLRSLYVGRITEYLWVLVDKGVLKLPCISSAIEFSKGFIRSGTEDIILLLNIVT